MKHVGADDKIERAKFKTLIGRRFFKIEQNLRSVLACQHDAAALAVVGIEHDTVGDLGRFDLRLANDANNAQHVSPRLHILRRDDLDLAFKQTFGAGRAPPAADAAGEAGRLAAQGVRPAIRRCLRRAGRAGARRAGAPDPRGDRAQHRLGRVGADGAQ